MHAEKTELHFLGQVINKEGVRPDTEKVSAINTLNLPESVQELRRALGMINYLGHRQYTQTLGALSSTGGAENGGE